MNVNFGILGRTMLRIGGEPTDDWGKPRERALLAALLIHPSRQLSAHTLVEWIWPEERAIPRKEVSTLNTYASRVRRSLERTGRAFALTGDAGGYRLEIARSEIDYYHFKRLIGQARDLRRQGLPNEAADSAIESIQLWRGAPLEDLHTERARNWRERVLADEWIPANTTLLEILLELGRFDEALSYVDEVWAEYPNDLSLLKLRIRTLHALDRQTDATACYLAAWRRLTGDADDQSARLLRQYYEALTAAPSAVEPAPPERISTPQQLPHDPLDFVGRRSALDALDTAASAGDGLRTSGVVVVDGVAGVGKTALVVHWAHRVRTHFVDGILFASLAGYSGDATVTSATVVDDFLIALGHPPDAHLTDRAKELLLSNLLAGRKVLVILDNVHDAAHVKDLVPLLSSALVVLTSRQRLTALSTATGARRVQVDPMTDADAIELLIRRIGAALPETQRTRLARLCGGLPLGINILAEHVSRWSSTQLAEFIEQLDPRQLVADVGDGSTNLAQFFEYSYVALPDTEQRLFRLLGLHPGPDISIDAASACGGRSRDESSASLRTLVAAHLIEQSSFNRYRFHELLKEFAAIRADQDEPSTERGAATLRMISFYYATAARGERILYPNSLPAPNLPVERDVEPVAFTNADQARSWFNTERTNVISVLRQAAASGYHDHAWHLADSISAFFDRQGYYQDGLVIYEIAVSSARSAGLREAEASSQVGLGIALMTVGKHAQARNCFNAALRFAESENNIRGQASTLHYLARIEMSRGDAIAAVSLYRRSLPFMQQVDDLDALSWTYCRLGEALRATEQYDKALVNLHQALTLSQRAKDLSVRAKSLAELGATYRDLGDHKSAAAHCEQALDIVESIANLSVTAQICVILAEINNSRGDHPSAIKFAQQAINACQRSHNVNDQARAHEILGDIHLNLGEPLEAALAWQHANDLYDQIGNPSATARVRDKISHVPIGGVPLPRSRSGWRPSRRMRARRLDT